MFHSRSPAPVIKGIALAFGLLAALAVAAGQSRADEPGAFDLKHFHHHYNWFDVCKRGCRYNKIQRAVDAAHPGETIRIGPGTYYENVVIDKRSVTLIGASADETTVDGLFRGPVFVLGPLSGGAYSADISVTLADMTITHGQGVTGGGIVQNVLNFLVKDSLIVSNIATQSGGGIDVEASSVSPTGAVTTMIDGCIVARNQAPVGAGIEVWVETGLEITNSVISGNSGGSGAGLHGEYASNTTVVGSTFSNNSSSGDGGGIWIASPHHVLGVPAGSVVLENSAVVNNTAANLCGGFASAGNTATTCEAGGPGVVIALNVPGP
jgi:hypothetical protein